METSQSARWDALDVVRGLTVAGMLLVNNLLATVTWGLEVRRVRGWAAPCRTFGLNPLVAFLGSGAMARVIGSLLTVESGGHRLAVQQLIYQRAFASWLTPVHASLGYAMTFVAVWYAVLLTLERRGWTLRL